MKIGEVCGIIGLLLSIIVLIMVVVNIFMINDAGNEIEILKEKHVIYDNFWDEQFMINNGFGELFDMQISLNERFLELFELLI